MKGKKRTLKEIFDPIRNNYNFAQPDEELAPYVEFFSESIINDSAFSVEMFPSWTPTAYINLGKPYSVSLDSRVHYIPAHTDILLLRDCATIRHNPPGDCIFTIKFRPGGLEAIMGVSQLQLKGKIFSLDKVFLPEIIDHIKTASSFNARTMLAEQYLLKSKQRSVDDHYSTLVKDITDHYLQNNMQYNVSQLAEQYFITSKSINRYFHRVIGVNPKDYFSILRTRAALTAYFDKNQLFNPCNFGYYDNSHFYKDAARFTGFPLSSVIKPLVQN